MKTFTRTTLAAAVGGLMAAGSAQAATTSYNLMQYITPNDRLSDMPMAGDNTQSDVGLGDPSTGGVIPGGTAGSMNSRNPAFNPLGWSGPVSTQPTYLGGLPATWYEKLGVGETDTITTAEMLASSNAANGGTDVPAIPFLSTGGKAYQDWTIPGNPANWGHNADFGLFTLSSAADVTITLEADAANGSLAGLRPGFSVWSGWDTAGGTRHTVWLPNGAPALVSANPTNSNPPVFPAASSMGWGPSNLGNGVSRPDDNLGDWQGTAWNFTADGPATLTLTNLAAGDYTLVLGGACGRAGGVSSGTTAGFCTNGANFGYKLTFTTTAPVPVPAAVWLFGSALAGIGAIGRRRREAR